MRILLARTDRIGDLILSTAAIATVRRSFPAAHVAIVTSSYNRVVVERNDDVDELVAFERTADAVDWSRQAPRFDLAVALAPRIADLRIAGATRAACRVGYTYRRRWLVRLVAARCVDTLMLSEADPTLSEREPERRVRHEVDQLLDLVALAGAFERVPRLRLDVRNEDRAALEGVPERPIVLHLGARWFSTGSTAESTLRLLSQMADLGLPVLVTCPPESAAYAASFEAPDRRWMLLENLPFFVWAAAFERAACVVTVDTAATHVASAVLRPTVVVFEHRYFALASQEWAPYGVPNVLVRKPAGDDRSALADFRERVVAGVAQLIHA